MSVNGRRRQERRRVQRSIVRRRRRRPAAGGAERRPCGCERGRRHCPEGVALLAAADAAYEWWRATRDGEDWQSYLEAKERYDKHFWDEGD